MSPKKRPQYSGWTDPSLTDGTLDSVLEKFISKQKPADANTQPELLSQSTPVIETTPVPEYRSTAVPELPKASEPAIIEQTKPAAAELPESQSQITAVPQYRSTPVPDQSTQSTTIIPQKNFYKKPNEAADHIDRNLTPAESKIFDHLLRLSVGFQRDTCQIRVSTLQTRTGYRSDKTVRDAINGLVTKGLISRRSHHNSPLGDEYQILDYSGNTGVPEYRSTAAKNTAVLESKITGDLKTSEIKIKDDDDGAARPIDLMLRSALPDRPAEKLHAAAIAMEQRIAAELVERASHATTPPVNEAYYQKILDQICTATSRPETSQPAGKGKGKPLPTAAETAPPESPAVARRRVLDGIATRAQFAFLNQNPTREDLLAEARRLCTVEGIEWDAEFFGHVKW